MARVKIIPNRKVSAEIPYIKVGYRKNNSGRNAILVSLSQGLVKKVDPTSSMTHVQVDYDADLNMLFLNMGKSPKTGFKLKERKDVGKSFSFAWPHPIAGDIKTQRTRYRKFDIKNSEIEVKLDEYVPFPGG